MFQEEAAWDQCGRNTHTETHTQSLVVCLLTASYSKACLWGVLGSGLGQKPQECFNGSGCNTRSTG